MPLEYVITELQAEEAQGLIGSSIMVESLLSGNSVASKIMFVSSYVPIEVTSAQDESMLTYTINVDPDSMANERLWFVEIQCDCPTYVDYVSSTIDEPLYQGKRGGAIVVVRFA